MWLAVGLARIGGVVTGAFASAIGRLQMEISLDLSSSGMVQDFFVWWACPNVESGLMAAPACAVIARRRSSIGFTIGHHNSH